MVDWGSPRWLNLCSTWGSCRFSACAFLLPGFQGGTATNASLPPDTNPLGFQTFSQDIMIGLVTISLFLLAAATYCFVRKGACRERCQRQQQVPSHEAEGTDDNEIHYSTIAHVGRNKPRVQELNSSTTYDPVRPARSQPRERSSMAQGESPSPACSL
ncbi:uncharacterized protein LOC127462126 isoform X3 [Manacus candei]|uniref:uncharacterized protein LOC127462126 isoform X3 n=1 Tax=Manacus candei TaxID=415023 RepID=UPI002227A465|nr:uncharacterized protein LOC127462126 isoform X3 [Manacus candei]